MKKKRILSEFKNKERYIKFLKLIPENLRDKIVVEKRMFFSPDEPTLSVVVGESGIGKTTEICQYAKQIREAGYPVLYVNLRLDTNYKFKDFLVQTFGTSDENFIIDTIYEKFTKKGKVPTIIIDNIHYALENVKIDKGMLTFLNGQFYQGLQMSVIMLASINEAADELQRCNFFHLIFHLQKILGSGYSDRLKIVEIEPFSKKGITQFLSSNKILEKDSDIEKYQHLFDGNMKKLVSFVQSKKKLEGIFFFFSLLKLKERLDICR